MIHILVPAPCEANPSSSGLVTNQALCWDISAFSFVPLPEKPASWNANR